MLKKAAMNILVKISKFEEVAAMEKHFKSIDKNGSGSIDVKELKAYF
jgi:Ca2+-binding EF-hand superfamily protein